MKPMPMVFATTQPPTLARPTAMPASETRRPERTRASAPQPSLEQGEHREGERGLAVLGVHADGGGVDGAGRQRGHARGGGEALAGRVGPVAVVVGCGGCGVDGLLGHGGTP